MISPETTPHPFETRKEHQTPQQALESLVNDIDAVCENGRIVIYCGEARASLYGHERFLETATEARYKKNARFQVIAGPLLVVDDNHANGLLHLKDKHVVEEMLHRPVRGWTHHFRVIQTGERTYRYSTEVPHPLLPQGSHVADLTAFSPHDIQLMAQRDLALFDNWAAKLRGLPRVTPLLLTERELHGLQDYANSHHLHVDDLTVEELAELHRRVS